MLDEPVVIAALILGLPLTLISMRLKEIGFAITTLAAALTAWRVQELHRSSLLQPQKES